MAEAKKTKKDHPEAVEAKRVTLPALRPEDKWIDQAPGGGKTPRMIKRLVYLPQLALRTAEYAHENELSSGQKDVLLLSFRGEADAAFGAVYEQVQITVGNSPAHRIGYLKDFESWKGRLIGLLKEALDCCMNKKTWLKKLEALRTEDEPLLHSNRKEWCRKFWELIKNESGVFYAEIYWRKFADFTSEALELIQFGSAMIDITMEQPQWMYQAMKNVGKLPEKYKNMAQNKGPSLDSLESPMPCSIIAGIVHKRSDNIARTLKAHRYPVVKAGKKNYCNADDAAVLWPKWKKYWQQKKTSE